MEHCNTIKILVIDDEPEILRGVSRYLTRSGFDVHQATNYNEALAALHGAPLDVVVSDHQMPGPGGVEVLKAAQRVQPDARRIMYSGCAPMDLRRLARDETIHDFIAKTSLGPLVRSINRCRPS